MDANGLKFWMLAEANHFHIMGDPPELHFDTQKRCLKLARQRRQLSLPSAETIARERLELTPYARDNFNSYAFWHPLEQAIMVAGNLDDTVEIFTPATPPESEEEPAEISAPTDFLIDTDGVFYIAIDGAVIMQDKKSRWEDVTVQDNAFTVWRIAKHSNSGIWLLDRDNKQMGFLAGTPLPVRALRAREDQYPTACENDLSPPTLFINQNSIWPDNETPVAIASNANGDLAAMSWDEQGRAWLRLISMIDTHNNIHGDVFSERLVVSDAIELNGILFPYSLAWIDVNTIAVIVAGAKEAIVYEIIPNTSALWPAGDIYPLKSDYTNGPFVQSADFEVHYPTATEPQGIGSHALTKLCFPFFIKQGFAYQGRQRPWLDSGNPKMHWHRLFVEAVIPKGCGIKIWLAASDNPMDSESIVGNQWFEHRFGSLYAAESASDIPVAVWESVPSEIPHHQGFIPCAKEQGRSGLFSVLIQRNTHTSRALTGRYLHMHIALYGTGRTTPEIYAIRAYGSRFSYINEYLPEFYRQQFIDSGAEGKASPEDFLERLVCNFEGVLTGIEDRVANAYLLTLPETTTSSGLDWLASWTGLQFDDALDEEQKRELIRLSAHINRWRGTLRGLKLALEKSTRGGISSGRIVVLEDFRLRRTFASIIGADLDDADDPLTAGANVSGNSYIGDTLFIGDENKREFLALFNADLSVSDNEKDAIDNLFDRLAHRLTVLVHEHTNAQDMGLIRKVVERETPAHTEARVLSASHPFLVGMASIVGVDTYLNRINTFRNTQLDASRLGRYSFINSPATLDPRLRDITSSRIGSLDFLPVARASDVSVGLGDTIRLDATASRAWQGRSITEYRWSMSDQ